jgi:transcriptional accessory protein Tex/SPT6
MQQNLNPQLDGGDEDFASLFEASLKERGGEGILKEGDLVKGTVVQVTKDYAVVDIGYKSEGQIPISEFTNPRGEVTVKDGDPVEVLSRAAENDTGMVVLSKEKADKMRIWDEISAACERDEIVKGVIVGPREGRPQRRHRREGVPSRQPGGHPPRPEPRPVHLEGIRVQGHQVQQEARQHRPVPARAPARSSARS